MSDAVMVAIIAGLSVSIPSMLVSILAHMKTRAELKAVQSDVHKIEKATNSMKDSLVLAARKEGHAQGVKDEKTNPTTK